MIIHEVVFQDFGVYGGRQVLDLRLTADDHYDRPIILFHGKNGVGKTSFVEGIRVALHGSLALGDRVSQREYFEHLKQRIHLPVNSDIPRPSAASIKIVFEMVREAVTFKYTIIRRWELSGTGLSEKVEVFELNITELEGRVPTPEEERMPPLNVAPENYEPFLRDLISPSASELFFFDGEKIDRLTSDEGADAILADAVQRLLGLHLVQQLEADLSIYIGRAAGQMGEHEMRALEEENKSLQESVDSLKQQQLSIAREIESGHAAIARQEQELADKGGAYAKEYPRLQKLREKLEQDIEATKRRMQDAASGLLPFAAAPKLVQRVMQRLDKEAQQQQQQQVKQLLSSRRADLLKRLADNSFWKSAGIKALDTSQQESLADLVTEALATSDQNLGDASEIFIHASERDRSMMLLQFSDSLGTVPISFHELADILIVAEAELDKVKRGLGMAPADIILQPIFDIIQQQNIILVELQETQKQLIEEQAAATFKLEQSYAKLKKVAESKQGSERVALATKAQQAIHSYAQKLRAKKLEALEVEIITRFNSLCRKGAMLDSASIDLQSFGITLMRNGEKFKRSMLSAGEKQLFALSILWGLREVAGLQMPVIIDTPLGRLDSDHRMAMLQKFLPEVAHQVILLATDTEIDTTVIDELAPAVSHGYRMTFDTESGSTAVIPLDNIYALTVLEEVTA
jgi:DNA sulfur modification protein DndD